MAASQEETSELAELHDMIYGAVGRESAVPVGLYVKFEVSLENQEKAAQARQEREARDQIRIDKAKAQYESTQEKRAKVRGRNANVMKELQERNLEQGRLMRAHKAEWELMRQTAKQQLFADTKVKADKARANDKRLDLQEEATNESERREGTRDRVARSLAVQNFRANLLKEKRERAETCRADTQRANAWRISELGARKGKLADQTRSDFAAGKELKQREEQERLRRVAASRARTLEQHQACARAKEEMLLKRQIDAQNHDRMSEIRIAQAKNALLRSNQTRRQQQFCSRYVGKEAASSFEASTFRHYYMMDEVADKEIASANAKLMHRIKTMESRTDDDITDDIAGYGRVQAEAASKARKAAEAARIARQNAEMRVRLSNIKASVDDDISDDVAGAARAKAAAASDARKKAEAAKLAKENAEMRARLKNVKAVTDDDITDESAGAARVTSAANSKARKASEAAKLARENREMKKVITSTAARTDDDISDEAAGVARAQQAADLKARREAKEAKLKKENDEMKERIANTAAKVDDDITDEAAGKARENKGLFTGLGWGQNVTEAPDAPTAGESTAATPASAPAPSSASHNAENQVSEENKLADGA